MTLYEMSFVYEDSTLRLRARLTDLRARRKVSADGEERYRLGRRIAELEPILRETRELAALTRHYYERSYYRNEKYRV
ncbi:MAG: hypothetical protein RR295_05910 [Oscillospiraceae bacterium]